MPESVSERYRVAAFQWVDLEAAANLLEETKSSVLAERMSNLCEQQNCAVNRSEMLVKASGSWREHLAEICKARHLANRAKVEVDHLKMVFQEQASIEATARVEARL